MAWFRIDNRLIHGQVIEAWLPYLHAVHLVVVNDALAQDVLQQQIMQLAVPGRVAVHFIVLDAAKKLHDTLSHNNETALFLLLDCRDARALMENGVAIPILNVGNMHYTQGKKQLCTHVAASEEDISCLRFFMEQGTQLDFRCVPGDTSVYEEW